MRWLGLTGKLASGKDTAFIRLHELEGNHILTRFSFADELRLEIEDTLGTDLPALWRKPYSETVRRLLQWWGTDLRRAEDPDYWVRLAIDRARSSQDIGLLPVFTDVRFPNEADAIIRAGGLIVRVWAPESVRRERNGGKLPSHESETAMDEYEHIDYTMTAIADDVIYHRDLRLVLDMVKST